MTDEKRRPRPAAQYGPTGKQVAENVRSLRERRGLTIYGLAGKLRDAQRPITPSAVAKIERGERQVTADDLAALAIVLNTSPITLLLPSTWGDTDIEVTGKGSIKARTAWRWARGLGPANDWGTDDGVVVAGPDDDEYWDRGERKFLDEKEAFDAVTLPPELRRVRQHPAGRDADLVALHVDRLIRLSDRASDDVFEDQLARGKASAERLITELDRLAEERALRKEQKGGAGG